jgi:hypothetical protein
MADVNILRLLFAFPTDSYCQTLVLFRDVHVRQTEHVSHLIHQVRMHAM